MPGLFDFVSIGQQAVGAFIPDSQNPLSATTPCEKNCWNLYPPLSGDEPLRRNCLYKCASSQQPRGPGSGSGLGTMSTTTLLLTAGGGLLLAYLILK